MTTCYTYIRVSTDRQAKEGLSLDAQATVFELAGILATLRT